ncbi:MAG TPA: ATP-binding cassette domain-containing protein [Edaphocola sp.]|nr:ATP-binding cassette domain-containing protein [Edaphocola sp.]
MSLLKLQHIETGYDKKQVLFDVSLDILQGETILLVGSNGSGKSTLIKTVYGVVDVWNGTIEFDNQTLHTPTQKIQTSQLIGKGIMYIPQKNELYEDMSVLENLKMSLLHLNNKGESTKRISEVLEQMPILKEKRNQTANRLSGGERRLVSLGMAIANKPKLLLYDEPLAGLSSKNIGVVIQWLQVLKENGTTVVLVEHRIKELINFTDRIIGLKLGTLTIENLNDLETIKRFLI